MSEARREGRETREHAGAPANEVAEFCNLLLGQRALLWTTPSGRQYKSTLDGSSYAPYRH
jgi:hypothetical protein